MSEEEKIRLEQTEEVQTEEVQHTAAQTVARIKRRRIRYAAPLGFLVLLFAVIGVISVIVGTVQGIIKANDDTQLREELYTFLDPVMQFCPSDFESVETVAEADPLLLAAAYRVSETERVRQLREKDDKCAYPVEETLYRMIVPQATVEEAYRFLFGEDATFTHRTIGDVEYHADNACYYVPMSINTSGYVPVIGKITHRKQVYKVQVAYVANGDIEYDARGNAVDPTVDMAKYSQWYSVEKTDKGWKLLAVSAA